MFPFLRLLVAASLDGGSTAVAVAKTGAGIIAVCTGGYLVGRTATNALAAGTLKVNDSFEEWNSRRNVERFIRHRDAIQRRKTLIAEAVEAEIERRIKAGEISGFKKETATPQAAPAA